MALLMRTKIRRRVIESSWNLSVRGIIGSWLRLLIIVLIFLVLVHNVAKIAHRDIKPENILLSDHDEIKLSDFGLGTQEMESENQKGTKMFMPPECNNSEGKKVTRTQSADIWALGITLIILLTGKNPTFKN
jgi:serine/threonine protein kinase